MAPYAFAVFSGAFLLFQVQPLLGKYILPWFGGAPAVWTTCLLVFQVLLLAGYAYAYLSTRWLKPRAQVLLHLALLAVALLTLHLPPDNSWKPHTGDEPTLRICGMLAASIGLPFFVLSATAPLLTVWFGLIQSGAAPFRLYALSNAGSLLALLSYPAVVETSFTRATQALGWRAGLGVYGLCCAWAGGRVWRTPTGSPARPAKAPGPALGNRIFWLALPACASLLLVAVTNKICQDLAPVALLWVVPLSVYLLSFILCFSSPKCYDRRWFGPVLLISLATMCLTLSGALELSAPAQVLVFGAGLFVCCMVCHGELYRLRPHPAHLASFYLMLSAGGALGSAFVALIAPAIFDDYFELHWGLILCGGLFLLVLASEQPGRLRHPGPGFAWLGGAATLAALAFALWGAAHRHDALRVYRSRNFYGVLNVYRHESPDPAMNLLELVHGRVAHGIQLLEASRSQTPTLYYTTDSGVGRALALLPQEKRRIGVVGLGTGTLAAYMRAGDRLRFYEINPEVDKIAEQFFTFLKSCAGQVEVVLGDARLSLENEPPQDFDLLALDAFNGDAIPIHLLTREAFAVYQRHTKTNGVIAVHVSNLSVNLEPVVANLAQEFGYGAEVVEQPASIEAAGVLPSTWILLSREPNFIKAIALNPSARAPSLIALKLPLWTDDFNGVFAVMRWREVAEGAQVAQGALSEPGRAEASRAGRKSLIQQYREAVASDPNSSVALNNLACLLATAPDPELRNGPEAVALAEKACALTQYQNTSVLSTLAAAYAEAGRFEQAVATAEKACAMAAEKGERTLLVGNQQMLQYYRHNRAFHQGDQRP
jgi:tetratricopeptide (TPR) repeat protein